METENLRRDLENRLRLLMKDYESFEGFNDLIKKQTDNIIEHAVGYESFDENSKYTLTTMLNVRFLFDMLSQNVFNGKIEILLGKPKVIQGLKELLVKEEMYEEIAVLKEIMEKNKT